MLIILGEYCQNEVKYDHLKISQLAMQTIVFSPGSKRLVPGSKYNDLIGAMSAFNCLYLG